MNFSCRHDYLKMFFDNTDEVGEYCGELSGEEVFVSGKYALLRFHTNANITRKGFQISFSYIEPSKLSGTAYLKTSWMT